MSVLEGLLEQHKGRRGIIALNQHLGSGTSTLKKKLIWPNAGPVGCLVTSNQQSISQTQTAVPIGLIALC